MGCWVSCSEADVGALADVGSYERRRGEGEERWPEKCFSRVCEPLDIPERVC